MEIFYLTMYKSRETQWRIQMRNWGGEHPPPHFARKVCYKGKNNTFLGCPPPFFENQINGRPPPFEKFLDPL